MSRKNGGFQGVPVNRVWRRNGDVATGQQCEPALCKTKKPPHRLISEAALRFKELISQASTSEPTRTRLNCLRFLSVRVMDWAARSTAWEIQVQRSTSEH